MHIIIGLITAVAGLVWALYRLQNSGVDINSFNPFYWIRRRKWQQQLGVKPLHRITNPMDGAAVLVVAMAGLDGVVTREHRQEIIGLFIKEFGLEPKAAAELYAESSHLLKDVANVVAEVKSILAPTQALYEARHRESLFCMLEDVSTKEGVPTSAQQELLKAVRNEFQARSVQPRKW